MAKRADVPEFGTLSGLKVAFSAVSLAGPFFASMCADHGADVIWLESPTGSLDRSGDCYTLAQDRRNMRSLVLDIPSEEGKKVFLELMKDVDIYLEASKPGQYAKWGLTDEVLWEANPKLVIVHLSGFGQYGDPNYWPRASYDPIAQAFGGVFYSNSVPGQPMHMVLPQIADFNAALFAFGSALAAYIKAQKTGIGDSIDVAQYETLIRCMGGTTLRDWNYPEGHRARFHPGVFNQNTAGYDAYQCKDGNCVMMLLLGTSVLAKALPVFGLEFGSEEFPKTFRYDYFSPEGKRLNEVITKYCSEHTAKEVEDALAPLGVPAISALTFDQMLDHPHYQARESIVKMPTYDLKQEIWVSNVVPKLKNNPGKAWRQPPTYGGDSDDILADLGYTEEQIAAFKEANIVK